MDHSPTDNILHISPPFLLHLRPSIVVVIVAVVVMMIVVVSVVITRVMILHLFLKEADIRSTLVGLSNGAESNSTEALHFHSLKLSQITTWITWKNPQTQVSQGVILKKSSSESTKEPIRRELRS